MGRIYGGLGEERWGVFLTIGEGWGGGWVLHRGGWARRPYTRGGRGKRRGIYNCRPREGASNLYHHGELVSQQERLTVGVEERGVGGRDGGFTLQEG